jgi:hypothetical protein
MNCENLGLFPKGDSSLPQNEEVQGSSAHGDMGWTLGVRLTEWMGEEGARFNSHQLTISSCSPMWDMYITAVPR